MKYQFLINQSIKRNLDTDLDLCFYDPAQTLKAIKTNFKIINWHNYIENIYTPESREILLFFPCAANKPWCERKTKSKNYQILYKLLNKTNKRGDVSLHTVSEPLGIVGEKDYNIMPIYDNPGLFKWFVQKNKLNWNIQAYQKSIAILGKVVAEFLSRIKKNYEKILAFVKPNSNHYKILNIAKDISRVNIKIKPTSLEQEKLKNNYVWMANKKIQKLFIKYLS